MTDTPTAEMLEDDLDYMTEAIFRRAAEMVATGQEIEPSRRLVKAMLNFCNGVTLYRDAGGKLAFIDPKGNDDE